MHNIFVVTLTNNLINFSFSLVKEMNYLCHLFEDILQNMSRNMNYKIVQTNRKYPYRYLILSFNN